MSQLKISDGTQLKLHIDTDTIRSHADQAAISLIAQTKPHITIRKCTIAQSV